LKYAVTRKNLILIADREDAAARELLTESDIGMTQPEESSAPEPVGAYPHARRVGNLLFLSGIGPRVRGQQQIPGVTRDDDGRVVAHDIEAQCRSVFENVRAVLKESGATWEQLIDVTVFLTNMADDFDTFNSVYAEYFSTNQPCRTTVEVNCLPTPIAIELKCIAIVD
jgi:2-aminomuconate deaminase